MAMFSIIDLQTCVNLEVHPEVAGITEGLTAVFTLVRFHPHMPHEVHIEFSGCDKGPGTHAALELLLTYMTLTFRSGSNIIRGSITAAPGVAVISVCLSSSVSVAGPWGRGGAQGPIGQLLFLVSVLLLLWLLLLLLLLLLWWLLLLLPRVVLLRWAVAVWRLVMAVVTVMAAKMRLELREGRALFATLAELTIGHLRNTCADREDGGTLIIS